MDTKKTAMGNIYILSSRIIALACGFILHIFLARRLGPEIYGLYGLIMSILLWVEFTVMHGIPSTYRKVISEDENMFESVIHSMKRVFLPYCLVVLAVFAFASPLVSQVFNDSRLLLLLLIAGIDIPFYGMFLANISILNGHRVFNRQSMSFSLYALFKTIFVILLMLLGFGLKGALIGNILASFFGLLVAFSFVKRLKDKRNEGKIFDLKPRMVAFGFPYLLYILTANLLIHIDMWFVKGILNDDVMIGYYSASYNLSRPLFLLITGITAVLFPSFSKAISENNTLLSQKYIKQAMRFSLLILFPLAAMIGSTSDELITLLFTSEYLPASNSLKILLFGISIFSIFFLFLNIIAAKNKPFYCLIISLILIPIAISLNYSLINSYGIEGAAFATTLVSIIGVAIAGIYVWKKFGVIMNFPTLLRVTVATVGFYVISKYIEASGYYLFLEYFLLSLIYLGLLLVLGEIKGGDIKTIKETCYSPSKNQ
jgi:O-antigen/teichoic acid export membrane protein